MLRTAGLLTEMRRSGEEPRRDPRPSRVLALRARLTGHSLKGAGGNRPRTQKGPLALMAAQRSLSSATGVGTPYDTTRRDMKGLETWITGPGGTTLPYSKVPVRFVELTRR
ncbi:hypothetical protein GCM10010342_57760 [Streptomyces anulatus]|nr:hypothetical protein GCM10010342_57760 [Streptomyces anulatus]